MNRAVNIGVKDFMWTNVFNLGIWYQEYNFWVLQVKSLCSLQIYILIPNPQSDSIWRWGLLEVIRSGGWIPHEWD